MPVIDKQVMLTHFEQFNSAGIRLGDAMARALEAECSRDFRPELGDITVGLSSGTQGPRSAFMVSRQERLKWAGIMLARVLTPAMLMQMVLGRRPLKVAFLMRANSNLYTTLASRRIDFRFYDLLDGVAPHLASLQAHAPDILVAPSRVLGWLAQAQLAEQLTLAPTKLIAVAEVLEPDDRQRVEQAFGRPVDQLYQCTEGFLAYTCTHGVLHMNEEYVHIEPEWLDEERTRFTPVITDFTRTTQHFIRYRLNDVLRVRKMPCSCGNAALALDAVEGRSDDILWLPAQQEQQLRPLFPDAVRHAVSVESVTLPDYRIEQHGNVFHIASDGDDPHAYQHIAAALRHAAQRHGLQEPTCVQARFTPRDAHIKRRRIICIKRMEPDLHPKHLIDHA